MYCTLSPTNQRLKRIAGKGSFSVSLSVSLCLSVSRCFTLSLYVTLCLSIFLCFSMFLYVSLCFSMFLYVSLSLSVPLIRFPSCNLLWSVCMVSRDVLYPLSHESEIEKNRWKRLCGLGNPALGPLQAPPLFLEY